MMMLCGLKIIVAPMSHIPDGLRFGKNVVVVTASECVDLAVDSYAPKPNGPVLSLMERHTEYLLNSI